MKNKKVTKMGIFIGCMKPIALVFLGIMSIGVLPIFIFTSLDKAFPLSLMIFGLYLILMGVLSFTPLAGINKIKKQEKMSSTSFDEDMTYINMQSFFKNEIQYFYANDWVCIITGINISVINRNCVEEVYVGSKHKREYIEAKMINGKKMKFYIWNAPDLLDEMIEYIKRQ